MASLLSKQFSLGARILIQVSVYMQVAMIHMISLLTSLIKSLMTITNIRKQINTLLTWMLPSLSHHLSQRKMLK